MEIFDIVDENGLPTGETVERAIAHEKGIRHRTAHIWVTRKRNGKTQLLLQRRSFLKDSFPEKLDTSSAGHIKAGDEPLYSAQRELFEELGIEAKTEELKFIGNFSVDYQKEFYGKMFHDNEFVFVYLLEKNVEISDITIRNEELEEVVWFDFDEVLKAKRERNSEFCVPRETLNVLKIYLEKAE